MMRKMLFLFSVFTILLSCTEDDHHVQDICDFVDFKYYNGAKDYLGGLSDEYILIACDSSHKDTEIRNFISTLDYLDPGFDYVIHVHDQYKYKQIPLKFNNSKTCEQITNIISDLKKHAIIAYAHYTMQTDDCNNLIWEPIGNVCVDSYSSLFSAKVFDENDLADLNNTVALTKTELVGQNEFMGKWFTLRATRNSNGDALKMANYFYETGLFEHSEPDIVKLPVE